MAELTASVVDVCDYIYDKMLAHQSDLGLADVFYGDQDKLPRTPALCVEPDERPRELKGAQRMTKLDFRIFILIYHGQVTSVQTNRREADILAEKVEALLHEDPRFDGLLTHGMVTNIESGYANRSERSLIRTSRITFEGLSQQLLPS